MSLVSWVAFPADTDGVPREAWGGVLRQRTCNSSHLHPPARVLACSILVPRLQLHVAFPCCVTVLLSLGVFLVVCAPPELRPRAVGQRQSHPSGRPCVCFPDGAAALGLRIPALSTIICTLKPVSAPALCRACVCMSQCEHFEAAYCVGLEQNGSLLAIAALSLWLRNQGCRTCRVARVPCATRGDAHA